MNLLKMHPLSSLMPAMHFLKKSSPPTKSASFNCDALSKLDRFNPTLVLMEQPLPDRLKPGP